MMMSTGGRIGIKPIELFEVGAFYASFFNEKNKHDMYLIGADLQLNYGKFSAKGEVYRSENWHYGQ